MRATTRTGVVALSYGWMARDLLAPQRAPGAQFRASFERLVTVCVAGSEGPRAKEDLHVAFHAFHPVACDLPAEAVDEVRVTKEGSGCAGGRFAQNGRPGSGGGNGAPIRAPQSRESGACGNHTLRGGQGAGCGDHALSSGEGSAAETTPSAVVILDRGAFPQRLLHACFPAPLARTEVVRGASWGGAAASLTDRRIWLARLEEALTLEPKSLSSRFALWGERRARNGRGRAHGAKAEGSSRRRKRPRVQARGQALQPSALTRRTSSDFLRAALFA